MRLLAISTSKGLLVLKAGAYSILNLMLPVACIWSHVTVAVVCVTTVGSMFMFVTDGNAIM